MSDPGHDSGQEGSSGDAIQIQTDRDSDSEDAVILEEEIRGPIENLPKIGEPSKNYDVRDSVCYSHNWFYQKTVDGVPYAVCRLCEKEESGSEQKSGTRKRVKKSKMLKTAGGSTKGLFTHIQSHHQEEYKQLSRQKEENEVKRSEKSRKRKLSDGHTQLKLFSNNNNKIVVDHRLDPQLQSRWDAAVVEYVYEAGVSFEACQKLDILLRSIWPTGKLRVTVKNARTVARHVSEKSTSLKVDVYSLIKAASVNIKAFAFTTDLWRSRSLDSYMALTCHYINEEFQLVKLVPFIQYFGENRHTGKNLQLMMDQFMEVLGLNHDEFLKFVVCDNASNNVVMIRLTDGILEYYCAIHTMALCVKDIFLLEILTIKVQTCMEKCKELAKFVRRSEHNRNDLRAACKKKEIGFILPKKPVETRWNSKEANVVSILKLMPALQHLASHDDTLEWTERVPNAAEVKVLESLVEILTQIKITTKKWEGDKEPTLQAVVPELWNIKDVLETKINKKERYVSTFAKQLKALINRRFPKCGTENRLSSAAHYLDPEYQGLILKQFTGAFNKARDGIKQMASRYDEQIVLHHQDQETNETADETNDNLTAAQRLKLSQAAHVDNDGETSNGNRPAIEIEMEKYQKMKITHCSNILLFWKDNQDVLPLLSRVAREILAIPASSASSERVFSVGSLMCTARRSNLKPDKVSDLMLLKLNAETVESLKSKKPFETAYTPDEIKNLISVNFPENPDYDPNELVEYVEDMEDDEDENEYDPVSIA